MSFNFLFETDYDQDRYVYHYTSAEATFDYILRTHTLRLSPFANVNDPREAKSWQIGFAGFPPAPNQNFLHSFQNEFNRASKANCKLLCVATDSADIGSDKFHSKCFSRGHGHPRMWAQYGQNHKGICLVFDRKALSSEIHKQVGMRGHLFEGKVEYTNFDRREGAAFQLLYKDIHVQNPVSFSKRHIIAHRDVLFFQKSIDWSAESEYRWVLIEENEGHVYVDFGESLVAIIRGMDHRNSRGTAQILQVQGVRLAQMAWSNGVPMAMEYWHKN